MAQRQVLAHPPIQEAVVQFEFEGSEMSREGLETVAEVYRADGWKREETTQIDAILGHLNVDPKLVSAERNFVGFVMKSPTGTELVQLKRSAVAASQTRYTSWDALIVLARKSFDRYVSASAASHVKRISTRFINRVPPRKGFGDFERILERPPKTTDGLAGAYVSDFLRRHVIKGIAGGYSANLTVGTVVKEPEEDDGAPALVIDIDVFKECRLALDFDAFTAELAELRSIKNELFFGSITEPVVESFL